MTLFASRWDSVHWSRFLLYFTAEKTAFPFHWRKLVNVHSIYTAFYYQFNCSCCWERWVQRLCGHRSLQAMVTDSCFFITRYFLAVLNNALKHVGHVYNWQMLLVKQDDIKGTDRKLQDEIQEAVHCLYQCLVAILERTRNSTCGKGISFGFRSLWKKRK